VYSIYFSFAPDPPSTCDIAINSVHSHSIYYHSGHSLSSTFFTFLESNLLSYTYHPSQHTPTNQYHPTTSPPLHTPLPLHSSPLHSATFLAGADVCHLNLHKTFCIPHGGGGPGVGTSSFPPFTLHGLTPSIHCYGVYYDEFFLPYCALPSLCRFVPSYPTYLTLPSLLLPNPTQLSRIIPHHSSSSADNKIHVNAGSIGVAKHLAPHLPGHPLVRTNAVQHSVPYSTTSSLASHSYSHPTVLSSTYPPS
jgi:hypothetical protein